MASQKPINVIAHLPSCEETCSALQKNLAAIHACFVENHLKKLNCSLPQKLALMDETIHTSSVS